MSTTREDKWLEVAQLNEGDRIKLNHGDKVYEFVRLKRTKFIATHNGQAYDIPVGMFGERVGKVNVRDRQEKLLNEVQSLEKGEMFYIVQKGDLILFRFSEYKGGRIHGYNPKTNARVKIDTSLYGGKVSDL